MSDWNTYQAAYQTADQKTKDKLHSSLIPECVAENIKKYELDESNQKVLVRLFSEKILGLLIDARLIEEMKKAGIPSATIISQEISECLLTKKPSVADTSLASTPKPADTIKEIIPEAPNSLASEIAETEAALNAIPKMRTMVQDAQESATHTSSQSDLLEKNNRWTPKK